MTTASQSCFARSVTTHAANAVGPALEVLDLLLEDDSAAPAQQFGKAHDDLVGVADMVPVRLEHGCGVVARDRRLELAQLILVQSIELQALVLAALPERPVVLEGGLVLVDPQPAIVADQWHEA